VARIALAFATTAEDERAAAQILYAFTGIEPQLEDDQLGGTSRDGAVDMLLPTPLGAPELVEVTQSLDPRYQRAADATIRFEEAIAREYNGTMSWSLNLERDWETITLAGDLASVVARALNTASAAGALHDHPLVITPHVHALALGPSDPPVVFVMSRNAGARSFDEPYLCALARYLATDSTIRRRLDKLAREQRTFSAERCHLFLGLASTGSNGGLLPASPSYFTWGTFAAPDPLTDIWLHGGFGVLYHWTIETGWRFHELTGA